MQGTQIACGGHETGMPFVLTAVNVFDRISEGIAVSHDLRRELVHAPRVVLKVSLLHSIGVLELSNLLN